VATRFLYRFQYRKIFWDNLKKDRRKKNVFVEKYDEIRSFDGTSNEIVQNSKLEPKNFSFLCTFKGEGAGKPNSDD
jgi:hypothetical protein